MKKKRGKKKKVTKLDKLLRVVKVISVILFVLLLVEFGYLIYKNYSSNKTINYFDSINDFVYINDYYVSVGSNNSNDNKLERANITKYNSKKEKVWDNVYNKGYNSSYLALDVDYQNNTIVAVGSYESTKKENNKLLRTALLVKYDTSGKLIYEKKFQILGNSKFTGVKVVDDGYIVTGQSVYDDMTIGNKEGGAFLLKYSKDGKLLWKSSYGNNKIASYNNLLTYDNNIYAVGLSNNNVGLISKYDMNGNLITKNEYLNTDQFGFTGITINANGIVVSGGKNISLSDVDALVVNYDLDCNYLNEVIYRGKGKERYNEIVSDSLGNLIVVGTTSINSNKKVDYDGIIGKYKDNLKEISVLEYGEEDDDYFTQIRLVDNNYLVGGYSSYLSDGYLSKFITYSDALKVLEVK